MLLDLKYQPYEVDNFFLLILLMMNIALGWHQTATGGALKALKIAAF